MFGSTLSRLALRSPRNIVFSPHVDDEVIGCFQALNKGLITDVIYFYDITPERKREAEASAARFGFKPWFGQEQYSGYSEIPMEIHTEIRAEDTILCPTARDSHPQHARVSRIAREYAMRTKCKLMFYTVDMESFQQPLSPELREWKKLALAELFPSQSILLENEKYHLFEGYSDVDHDTIRTFQFTPVDETIYVQLEGAYPPTDIDGPTATEQLETYLNRLIVSYYNRGTVSRIRVTQGNKALVFNG